jgi:hypothetical protein
MPIAVAYGEVHSLCDTSCEGDLSPEEVLLYERAAIDFHLQHAEPLILEWHPELTNPGNPEWWAVLTGVLDHLRQKGDRVRTVTAVELVDHYVGRP